MAANGFIPLSQLAPIPGSGPFGRPRLRRDAAAAYNALAEEAMVRWGIDMALNEGDVGRAYRSYPRQQLAKRVYGSNAATPGTSNHGLGINVDLETRQQRWVIDKIGHLYGFSKRWSDAAWEWWHITFKTGVWKGRRPYPTLRWGKRGKRVKYLHYLLRRKGYDVPKTGKPGRGQFGNATGRAVKAFQKKKGMTADGVVGPRTWRALRR